jgi:ribosomal protein S27E
MNCNSCGADALIWSEDGHSVKCDECGQFSTDGTEEDGE